VLPDGDQYGESFRLHVRGSERGASFRGSYPYIDGDPESGERLDSFIPVAEAGGRSTERRRTTATNAGRRSPNRLIL